jgi:hypothetical protein
LASRVLSAPPRSARPGIHPAAASSGRVIAVGLIATGVMVALLAATQAIDFGFFNLRLSWLNTDTHFSVFGIASLLAQLAAAAAAAAAAQRAGTRPQRWAWLTLAVILAALVVIRTLTHYSASVLGPPLACVFALLCWLTWRDPRASRALVWAGLVLLMASLLLHEVGATADATPSGNTWGYEVLAIIKHGAELGGWMLVATGVVAGLKSRFALSRLRR